MTRTEEQLRDALAGIAELVQTTDQKVAVPQTVEHGGRRWVAWLVPAAVAVAVLLVIVVGVVAAALRPVEREPVAGPVGDGRYFLTVIADWIPSGRGAAAVRESATGKVSAMVPEPKDAIWNAVGAAADNRTFFLSSSPRSERVYGLARLYRLRIDDSGKVSSLTQVPKVAEWGHLGSLAVSPDGKRVAFPVNDQRKLKPPQFANVGVPVGPAQIKVVEVGTGRFETYSSSSKGLLSSLSWSADGRRLAFDVGGPPGSPHNIYVFDVRQGRDLLRDAIRLAPTTGGPLGRLADLVISADGTKVYVVARQQVGGGPELTRIIELDAATGRRSRVLLKPLTVGSDGMAGPSPTVARDPSGTRLLVASGEHGYRIELVKGHVARFPLPSGEGPRSVAWG